MQLTYKNTGNEINGLLDIDVYLDGERIGSVLQEPASFYAQLESGEKVAHPTTQESRE